MTLLGALHWLGLRLGDLGELAGRRLPRSAPAPRGHKAVRLGRPSRERLLGLLALALILGAALGLALGIGGPARLPPPVELASLAHPPAATAPPRAVPRPASRPPASAPPRLAARPPAPPRLAARPPAPPRPPSLLDEDDDDGASAHAATMTVARAVPPAPPGARPPDAGPVPDKPPLYEEPLAEPEEWSPPHAGMREGWRKPLLAAFVAAPPVFHPPPGPQPLWLRNALPMPSTHGKPVIAIVIDDMGVDRKRSERALRLPAAVTLSFLPYAGEVARQAEAARARGHEIMVHLPMEPENPLIDPGPHALRNAETAEEVRARLAWDLAQFGGYVAANNHMGSRFTRDAAGMATVLRELKARGLFFLDSKTTAASAGPRLARDIGLPFLERDVFLDNVDTREEVAKRLAELEQVARHDGYAIAIGHPRDATLDVMERWLPEFQARGFALVPISAVMRLRLAAEQQLPRLLPVGG